MVNISARLLQRYAHDRHLPYFIKIEPIYFANFTTNIFNIINTIDIEKYIDEVLGLPHLFLLIQRCSILIDPSIDALFACRQFFPESESAYVVHAATCLEAEAVLISNDAHFNAIKESRLIEVWNISEAIGKIL